MFISVQGFSREECVIFLYAGTSNPDANVQTSVATNTNSFVNITTLREVPSWA